ncbi:MAG: hypothetical protein IT269_10515 [Saprospiraceae bacterium]|nr:hypothetical protein [Saprospiraceae bacterium]
MNDQVNTIPDQPYAAEWAAVDSLEKQGLIRSALEKVDAIHARAKADNIPAQAVKALIYWGKYTTQLDDDGFEKSIQRFESELATAGILQKAILNSLTGQLYSAYLQSKGWEIRQRTETATPGDDIRTWSVGQLQKRAFDLYVASVSAKQGLIREMSAADFKEILMPGLGDSIGGDPLRPTLYDLLAHRALDFLVNEQNYLTEPVNLFELNQPEAFAPTADFVRFDFSNGDPNSGKFQAVKLLQQLSVRPERTEVYSDGSPSKTFRNVPSQIHVDLVRLKFAWNNSTLENKKDYYRSALETLHDRYASHPASAEILYELAWFYYYETNAADEKPKANQKAVELLERAIQTAPGSYAAKVSQSLLYDIRQQYLTCEVERAWLPEKPVLVKLNFRNVNSTYVKVVRGSHDINEWENAGYEWDKRMAWLMAQKTVQTRTWNIPDPKDYQMHSTEIALDALPLGNYWVICAENADFDHHKSPVSFANFTVTRLAGVSFNEQAPGQLFVLADRETGAPLGNVQLECFQKPNGQNNPKWKLTQTQKTDAQGQARVQILENQMAQVRAVLGPDSFLLSSIYQYQIYENDNSEISAHFFTDRSMYRPGQTVFFKTIVYKTDKEGRPQIMPKHSLTVKFLDVNGQEKGSKTLTTNEFGTFNGSFTAPASGLTGFMSIVAEGANGGASFSVEEYKLARFEVVMKPLEGSYRLDEKVSVTGEAKNYAGSAVGDAAVRYRVVRTPRFPYINYDYTRNIPNFFESPEREIANGTTTTDANGLFSIPFTLKADKSIPKSVQPLFEYKVTVDITDISGETRSGESWLHAAYSALDVALELPNEIHLDSLKKVGLTVNNMAGKPQSTSGSITMQRLVEPAVMPVQRFWDAPDVQTMDKATFKRNFPQFAYGNEAEPSSWDRADFIVPFTFNTAKGNEVNLSHSSLRAGWYLLVLETKDAYGESVKIERYIRVFDDQKRFVTPQARPEKNHYEPGETAKIQLGGQAENLNFFIAREQNGVLVNPAWAKSSVMEWRVTEADRGGILYHYIVIKNNRQYRESGVAVTVPWSNKELKVSYESFRDKLAPGQKEEWRIRISGPNKEKVAAEMVATLYDASLDQYNPHGWQRIDFPMRYSAINVVDGNNFTISGGDYLFMPGVVPENGVRMFQEINWFDFPMWGRMMYRSRAMAVGGVAPGVMADMAAAPSVQMEKSMQKDSDGTTDLRITSEDAKATPPAQLRRNLNETVFFFPEIRTDANGDVVLRFTMNESLTRWNLFTFAHTKDLQQVLSTKSVVTQKELMVISNPPRFLRAGDEFEFAAKVSNLSQESLSGTATLNLLDANTLQPLETAFGLGSREARVSNFSIQPGQSAPLTWRFKVPEDFTGAVTWQIFADGKKWRDGEENTLPVVSNRMLVTETMPITVRGNQRKTFTFEPLKNLGQSSTLTPHNLTLEFTSNPVWYAVQALPYLMEYPYECSEQVFSRFYANTLASSVTQKMPNIRRIYDRWKGTDALKSNLSKNQELKTALLEETPWVMDAQNEAQQKQNIALLFDLNRMSDERERALNTWAERQYEDGSWPWFAGGPGSWHITQHIASGMGHLAKLGAFDPQNNEQVTQMVDKALGFCDAQVRRHYEELLRLAEQQKVKLEDDHLDGLMIQYLYTRSFSPVDRPSPELAYYLGQAETHWLKKGIYEQGMLALVLNRYGRKDAAMRIVASLRERATVKEELGMFWPVSWGYYWYQLPIETQAIMVEVFSEVANDRQAVEELRIWLLKNKQTNRWESTKATAEAVYALLLNGDNWLENTKPVEVSLSGKVLKIKEYEAGTGYFKQNWSGKDITKSMSSIEVKNPNSNIAWGGAYFQYFEDLDQIKNFQETPLKIVKQLYLEENSPTGPILKPVAEGASLKRGDKLKVRIEIRVDRAMEYVHLKDMRAAGLEPINVLSQYKWQDGLGYYESTKDLATHFFIDYLPKGTFVFEYPVVVSHRGNMSNGITTMQCMYAPEFSSHSKGVRIKVD